jgi:hypothetical protein
VIKAVSFHDLSRRTLNHADPSLGGSSGFRIDQTGVVHPLKEYHIQVKKKAHKQKA